MSEDFEDQGDDVKKFLIYSGLFVISPFAVVFMLFVMLSAV